MRFWFFICLLSLFSADALAVETSRSGWLRELRLCYDRKFLPSPCPRGQRGAGDAIRLKVWRGL